MQEAKRTVAPWIRKLTIVGVFLSVFSTGNTICAQEKLYSNSFNLSNVRITDGPFRQAMDLNIETLLAYDEDRLLAPYLKEAGLEPRAPSFSNWIGLDGHVGGHYLTGLAIHYAASGDQRLKAKMDYVLSELSRCQDAHGNGYLGGVPNGENLWKEIEEGNVGIVWKYWVPWYNVHKTFAGLRDAWLYADNEQARQMFLKLCDWGVGLTKNLSDQQMESMLANEFGGMNEVFADAYAMTNDERYLHTAIRFSHKEILDSMAKEIDNLDNKHANTQVPKAVGYQRVSELTQDPKFRSASQFFWKTVVHERSLSLGGNSRREHFPASQDFLSYMEEREGPESCNTNNMLKLTSGLFRERPDAALMDYYERAMYNHILSTQHPEHGGYVYFTPARPGHYRVYSDVNSAMWCCVGTGLENHGKYGEIIYTHIDDSLYVNLFVPSELDWQEKKVQIKQITNFPDEGKSKIHVNVDQPTKLAIKVRFPSWISEGKFEAVIDGRNYAEGASPGSYVVIERTWNPGDVLDLTMAVDFYIEELKNHPEYISIFRGPILMGAEVGTENLNGLLADDHRWAHIAHGPLISLFDTPIVVGDRTNFVDALNTTEPSVVGGNEFAIPSGFVEDQYSGLLLKPFYAIHDSRYMMYWLHATRDGLDSILVERKEEEKRKLELDRVTIDMVKLGEQQPEVDHRLQSSNSSTGIHMGESYREAGEGGEFSIDLTSDNTKNQALLITYWGYESGNKTIDIKINNKLLVTERIDGKWDQSQFFEVKYDLPKDKLGNDAIIKLTIKAKEGHRVPKIFRIRLIEDHNNN